MRATFLKAGSLMGRSVILAAILVCAGCGRKSPPASSQAGNPSPAPAVPALDDKGLKARLKLNEALQAQLGREYDRAIRLFGEAVALDPKLTGVDYQIAVCQMNLGNEPESKKTAYKSIGRKESVAQAYNLIGTMAGRAGNYAEAEWAFGRATEAAPADPMAFYDWSESLRAEGKFSEAVQKLRAAIQRNPGEPLYALKLRLARIEVGEALALVPDVDRELALQPPAADWQMTAAAIALKYGKYQDAARLLDAARHSMQPILFFGLIQEDPFFREFKRTPEIAPFYDVNISVNTPTPQPAESAQPVK
jgi:Flp pilus assembly protein TadD